MNHIRRASFNGMCLLLFCWLCVCHPAAASETQVVASAAAETQTVASAASETQAVASTAPAGAVVFTDESGSYLMKKGKSWYLKDAAGQALAGIQYLAIAKTDSLNSGFYMFDSKGKLLAQKAVYYLDTTVNEREFKGYYYTNKNGRFPETARGLVKLSKLTCKETSKTFSGYYYLQEYGKLSADAQVRKISRTKVGGVVFHGYYYFTAAGKLSTAKKFRKVNQTVGSRTFSGKYYFGGKNGVLVQSAGWITYKGNKYYINAKGKVLTNCWKDGYYLLSSGKIAKSQKVADGSYVDCDGHKCAKNEVALSSLKKTLKSMISGYSGTWSVYVKNLETGDVLSINDTAMYPASTIKAFVMASLYNEIKQGHLSETSQIKSLLTSMITVSSNEAYNSLVTVQGSSGFLSGAAVVNNYLKENGYSSTSVHHTLHPASTTRVSDGGSNTSSAKDCGKLLERIYKGTCVSKAYSKKMLNLMLSQQRRSKIPAGIPSGIKVANKTGETSTTNHDIAIVYGAKTDYVICVFSRNSSVGVSGIVNISRTVYNYLN
ncbi:MAG: serine hydrolase [Lachnospiraceae bacterium]|nr:serine hydrolase [Lachnospiraceae bacterium]